MPLNGQPILGDKLLIVEDTNGNELYLPVSPGTTCSTVPTLAQAITLAGLVIATKPVLAGASWEPMLCQVGELFSIQLEAENVINGTGSSNTDAGASVKVRGDFANSSEFLEFKPTVPTTGTYRLILRFRTLFSSGTAGGTLIVNGGAGQNFTLPAKNGTYDNLEFVAFLNAGPNSIRFQGRDIGTGNAYQMDYLTVRVPSLASATAGAGIVASSTLFGYNLNANYLINGYRMPKHGSVSWAAGEGWNSAAGPVNAQFLDVNFNATRTLSSVTLFSAPDDLQNTATEPTDATTFSLYGITAFRIQLPDGEGGWTTIATVTGNNLVKRTVSFTPVQTDQFRVQFDASADGAYARLIELEAN